ncbi:hypothetical protein BH23PAT2_BH23PAT2_09520 [soil metagenome]
MKNINQSGMAAPVILAVVVVVALAGAGVYIAKNNSDDKSRSSSQIKTEEPASSDGNPVVNQEAELAELAMLAAVGDYSGEGEARRSFVDGKFEHSVNAKVSDPADGKFYEGWLVKGTQFISTGKLAKADGINYSLSFTSSNGMSDYNKVVITEETEANGLDNKPEAHVLEGSF